MKMTTSKDAVAAGGGSQRRSSWWWWERVHFNFPIPSIANNFF